MGGTAMSLAQQQVTAAEQPILQQIQAERQANLAKAQQVMGFSKAAAALLQGIAPRVTNTYTNAANADAGYARGLGDVAQHAVSNQAASDNAFLQKMGTPSGGLVHPADVGGTAYGLEGYIPATTLQREGAAFGSAAQMLPAESLRAGQQQASAALNDPTQIAKLQAQLGQIAASQPKVYQDILNQLSEMGYRNAQVKLSQGRLNLAQQSLASTNAYRQAELGQSQQRIDISRGNYKIALAKLGIAQKQLQLKAIASQHKADTGGFTPNELMGIKQKSYADAQRDFHGSKPTYYANGQVHTPGQKPLSFKQAFKRQVLNGIPPSIALQELRAAGYKPPVKSNPFNQYLSGGFFGAPAQAAKIVSLAHEYLGTPYVWGGASPKGFDCSGFAEFLYNKVGISIPRTTYTQWTAKNGRAVPKNQLQPGDLVFFRGSDSKGGLPGHVGIYIGNGQMIDAPHTGADVRIESVANFGGYMGARRYHR